MVMWVNTEVNTYSRVAHDAQRQCLVDKVSLEAARTEELHANFAGISHRTLKGLPPSIDPDRPPKNFKDAMSRDDKQEWAVSEAYNKKYQGFKERNAFKMVGPYKGIRFHDILTRLEYKEDNGTFFKGKVCLCARGDQQIEGEFQIILPLCPHSKGSRSKTVGSNRSKTLLPSIENRYAAGNPLRRNGRRQEGLLHKTTRLVARTDSRRACSSASQKHVWHEIGRTTMAYAHLKMDGAAWIPSDEYLED